MYLKSLELHGFKSFPNKTTLNFMRGSTVIIGPNGSGKSNISDAMRWVLGELSSKNIRGSKMEDVIFGGADSRKPMGFAEVSVTFDNTDAANRLNSPYDEITVTRRYYRAGSSEYYINRRPVRLKDIYELFMNTGIGRDGYSVIGQGKIAEILSKKSEDRRSIFEDAAGIAKYRYKKQETERALEKTDENMVRIEDNLSYLESRVGPLEKESEKARKYLDLYDRKKRVDVSLWLYDTEKLRRDIKEAEDAFKISEHELEIADDTLRSLQTQSDRLFEESQAKKLESERIYSEIDAVTKRLHEIDSGMLVAQNEAGHKRELAEQGRNSLTSLHASVVAAKDEQKKLLSEAEGLEKSNAERQSRYEALRLEQEELLAQAQKLEFELAEKQNEIRACESEQMDIQVRISVLEGSRAQDDEKSANANQEAQRYEEEAAKLEEDCRLAKESVDMYASRLGELDGKLGTLTQRFDELTSRRDGISEELGRITVERSSLEQRIDTLKRMEEHFEGYSNTVRHIMRKCEEGGYVDGKIYGPLSKLISTDTKYITAIETALGQSMQNIVVDTEQTAKDTIYALKRDNAGRATFYPVSSIKYAGETDEIRRASQYDGYVGRADTLVECEETFAEINRWLLGRTLVFDSLDNASKAAKELRYKVKIVTLDGQVINAGGSFTGGSVKRDSGILSRSAEIETLTVKLAQMTENAESLEKELSSVREELEVTDNELGAERQTAELLKTMLSSEQSKYETAKAKLDANSDLRAMLRSDLERIGNKNYDAEHAELAEASERVEKKIEEMKAARAETEISRHELLDLREQKGEAADKLFLEMAECRRDIEVKRQLADSAAARGEEFAARADEMLERIRLYERQEAELDEKQSLNRDESNKLRASLEKLSASRVDIEAAIGEIEVKMNASRIKINEKTNQKEVIFRAHTKNETHLKSMCDDLDKMTAKLWEDYELTYLTAVAMNYPEVNEKNRAENVSEQTTLKNQLRALGNVNVGAIEEYTQVKTEYDSLKQQVDDLRASKEDLCGIIAELDKEMRAKFTAAFSAINANFAETFRALFGGGSAELSLSEPDDVLNSGIEIKAAPPGKIIKNMTLLSGGEQAFIAIALLFAILKVNPAPFCILDEIEAALDEVNVKRFAEYIKEFDSTQFVLITHRRGTMEAADCLYGVTMPERGISRVLTLDINDIESRKRELGDGIL